MRVRAERDVPGALWRCRAAHADLGRLERHDRRCAVAPVHLRRPPPAAAASPRTAETKGRARPVPLRSRVGSLRTLLAHNSKNDSVDEQVSCVKLMLPMHELKDGTAFSDGRTSLFVRQQPPYRTTASSIAWCSITCPRHSPPSSTTAAVHRHAKQTPQRGTAGRL